MPDPFYGDFDGLACRYSEDEAWVLHDQWVRLNSISVNNAVRELNATEFNQLFPAAPPLPVSAFKA